MTKIAIIGTAGRKGLHRRLSREIYGRAYYYMLNQLEKHGDAKDLILSSGGAAWMDHLAVSCFAKQAATRLHLQIPAKWNNNLQQYVDTGVRDWKTNPGGTSNYYHRLFSERVGENTLRGLHSVMQHPNCEVTVIPGLFERNKSVAQADTGYFFTFGTASVPESRGTLHTWNNFTGIKHHVSLTQFE